MKQHLEVETKFSVSESTQIPHLEAIADVDHIDHTEIHHLSAVYFDTADLRLTRAKITLRRRTGGNDDGWHIKFPGSIGRREVQAPLDGEGATENTPPRELLGHVRAMIQGRELLPIAQVENERHMSYLADSEGTVIAEFCDDHVSTVSHLPGGIRKQWREWEFELVDGTREEEAIMTLLQSAQSILTSAGAFVSKSPSKLVSALDDSINHAPQPPQMAQLDKNDPARGVLSAIATNAHKIAEYDPRVRADEYDSVHQMRVATRELRSHLQTFEGILGGEDYLNLEKELKVLANILGRARDAEVVEERLSNLIDTEVGDSIEDETKQELLQDLGAEYQREHERVVRALDNDRYTDLLQSLEKLLVDPPLVVEIPEPEETVSEIDPQSVEADAPDLEALDEEYSPGTSALEEAPQEVKKVDATLVLLEHLDKAHVKLVKLEKKARSQWDDLAIPMLEREENFHNVRKAAKKLRYSAEAVGKATSVDTKKLYKACSSLQSVLGDYQDAITSRDELLRRSQAARRQNRDTFAYGVLYQHEQTLSREYLTGYSDAFKSVEKAYEKLAEITAKRAQKNKRA
ncbi:CYTH and CHAD domain-containing protein [Corynebacterium crudilactis]|uniref:Metal-chelation protein CHAD n=1 Tax=Corynebacterium crudilactis TaxID=1652495 RepID=A0A172QUT8_9CORY|nr:CYTH and CHAD domain-containing protein [Corynebacterium crudilactis]ANE04467.1 metal-chelation protein CHAD [Corynebacterium crudilactis]